MRPAGRESLPGKPSGILVALNFSSRRVPLALADDVRAPPSWNCPATPDVSSAVDLTDLVLEPDEGMILRRRTLAERVMSGGVGRRSLGWKDKTDEPIGVNW